MADYAIHGWTAVVLVCVMVLAVNAHEDKAEAPVERVENGCGGCGDDLKDDKQPACRNKIAASKSLIHKTCARELLGHCILHKIITKLTTTYSEGKPYCCGEFKLNSVGRCVKGCPEIENCAEVKCDAGENEHCAKCDYDNGGGKQAYRLAKKGDKENGQCEKLCSWRDDSSFCFPGRCTDGTPDTCQCDAGFEGKNCMKITPKPTLARCNVDSSTKIAGSTELTVDCTRSSTVYTNKQLRDFHYKIDWYADLTTKSEKPSYVAEIEVGITTATILIQTHRNRLSEDKKFRIANVTRDCLSNHGHHIHSPADKPLTCRWGAYTYDKWNQNDKITITHEGVLGGYLKINDYDEATAKVSEHKYFDGPTVSHSTVLIFDFDAPKHCSLSDEPCTGEMLEIGESYTRKGEVLVKWSGWTDEVEIMGSYVVEVYSLAYSQGALRESTMVQKLTLPGNTSSANINLDKQSGVYSIILTVADQAGNKQVTRRYMMYDDKSSVQISTNKQHALCIVAANGRCAEGWINTDDRQVELKWTGHFYNDLHRSRHMLEKIIPRHELDTGYDQLTGQPPETRSLEAIPNAHGIVSFQVASLVYQKDSGKDGAKPDQWKKVFDVKAEKTSVDIPRSDGDIVKFFVRATDVMGNSADDSITLYSDGTPPVIENMKQMPDPIDRGSKNNFRYWMKFDAYDYHSGLKTIQWSIRNKSSKGLFYSGENLDVKKPVMMSPDWEPGMCYCVPATEECYHKQYTVVTSSMRGYQVHLCEIYVRVTNHAGLTTGASFEVQM